MSETCKHCGREKYSSVCERIPSTDFKGRVSAESCSADSGFESDVEDCGRAAELRAAYERGLREGFAIAEEHAEIAGVAVNVRFINWRKAHAELERRLGGKERGE